MVLFYILDTSFWGWQDTGKRDTLEGQTNTLFGSKVVTMNQSSAHLLFDLPGRYRIRVQGQLNAGWSSRFSDMTIVVRQPASQRPVTTLTGEVRDQATLLGVLNALYDLGFPLLKVERLADVGGDLRGVPPGPGDDATYIQKGPHA